MSRPTIAAVIFDAGGVLIHPNMAWLSQALAAHQIELDAVALHRAYYGMIYGVDCTPDADRYGIALVSFEVRRWMVEHLLIAAGVDQPTRQPCLDPIAQRISEEFPGEGDFWHWRLPNVSTKLERLKAHGLRLAVASNNDGQLDDQLRHVGLFDHFVARLDSSKEGVAKPDPELLWRAARRCGAQPDQCLFVGDIDRVDGAAARAAGMQFALIDPLRQPRATQPTIIADLDEILDRFDPIAG